MFFTRTISSIILTVVAIATICFNGIYLLGTLFLISIIAFLELTKASGIYKDSKKVNGMEIMGIVGITIYYAFIYFNQSQTFSIASIILTLMGLMFVYVFTFPYYHANDVMGTFFAIVYAPVMLSFVYLTRNLEHGFYLVWLIFISSWISDTAAYLVGTTLGKHKMTPKLSPKKSVEGAIGGILGAALVGGLFAFFIVEKRVVSSEITIAFILISAIGSIISQVGDLAASAIKRNHEIKDYGKVIPGHGGIMDRFDSVIFTAPIIYFLSMLLIS